MAETRRKGKLDYSLLFAVIFLVFFGLVMIYSASSYTAQIKTGDAAYYMKKQAFIALAGFIIMIVVSKIDYHKYIKIAFLLYFISYPLMIYVTFLGKIVNGKRRWISIGSFSFQPTEYVKSALIIFLAVYIIGMKKEINTIKGIGKVMGYTLPIALFVAWNNLSSGIIILAIAFIMAFVATNKKLIYGIIAFFTIGIFTIFKGAIGPIATFLNKIHLLKGYQLSRILVWLDPASYPQDGGYQVLQGLYAIGSGGIIGKGLGESIQKTGFVPEAQNDMIFSIICEELGLFGAVSIILVFMFIIFRCVAIANSARDSYGSFIVIGVMSHIAIQVILNIAVVTNVIPNTGISLPFISYGGSSILFLLTEMGMVLGISRSSKSEMR